MATDNYRSPHDSALFAGRFIEVLVVALLIEILRYVIHPSDYTAEWWWLIVASLGVNAGYHWWSMPDSHPKVIVSASYNQTTLPYLIYYLWAMIRAFVEAIVRFISDTVPGLPK